MRSQNAPRVSACGARSAYGASRAGRRRRPARRPHRSLALLLVALAAPRPTCAEVLVVRLRGEAAPSEFEAAGANWNQAIDDAGQSPEFSGDLVFDASDPGCCRILEPGPLKNQWLALVDAADRCGSFATTTSRAAQSGARGVVFFAGRDNPEVTGMALGHDAAPAIRAVMVARAAGEAARDAVLAAAAARGANWPVRAELRSGMLISEDAYEEQFIFRVDEFLSTRSANFLWHHYPEMLANSGREPLSSQFTRLGLRPPASWFSERQPFVPLFNPSLAPLGDSSFLATLRMSNGPGCPSVRRSKESSMDTRIFRNELVLAHIEAASLAVMSYVVVDVPPLVCRFEEGTDVGGRQFLDEVSGPMDARIRIGDDGRAWVLFYAERNAGDGAVLRGIHGAPLHIDWGACDVGATEHDAAHVGSAREVWALHSDDAAFLGTDCKWVGSGDSSSGAACRTSCDAAVPPCNAVNFRPGAACVLRSCSGRARTERLTGWQAMARHSSRGGWLRVGPDVPTEACEWLSHAHAEEARDCQGMCETTERCDTVLFSQGRSACLLQRCHGHVGEAVREDAHANDRSGARPRSPPLGWEVWRKHATFPAGGAVGGAGAATTCLRRAWVEPLELVSFPANDGVEKNWNLIHASSDRVVIEYHVEPHIVVEAVFGHAPDGGLGLSSFGTAAITRWPYEVIHGVTSVRGGYCCAELPQRLWQGRLGLDEDASGTLLLGAGHLQRIRSPFDQAVGDVNRFRRQAKSRTYHNFFYAIRGSAPFDVMAVSTEWCVSMNGVFSQSWRGVLPDGEDACEAIQFASGLALRGDDDLVVAYGINDCEADLVVVPLARVFDMLRPVRSDLNVSLEGLEII